MTFPASIPLLSTQCFLLLSSKLSTFEIYTFELQQHRVKCSYSNHIHMCIMCDYCGHAQTPVNVPDHWISFDIVSFGSRLRVTKIAISSFGMQFFDGKVPHFN